MAAMNCPRCQQPVAEQLVLCPGCGLRIAGGVFDFGVFTLMSLESHGFWWRSGRRAGWRYDEWVIENAEKSILRINRTKKDILRMWMLGLFGTIGVQQMAAGRMLSGSMRLLWGSVWWIAIIAVMLFTREFTSDNAGAIRVFLVALFAPAIFDLIKISLGWFRDVFGKKLT